VKEEDGPSRRIPILGPTNSFSVLKRQMVLGPKHDEPPKVGRRAGANASCVASQGWNWSVELSVGQRLKWL
jgi:hypothetical protein